MGDLTLINMSGEEIGALKDRLSKIKTIEGRMLSLGYKRVHVQRTDREYNSISYSSIVLATEVSHELPSRKQTVDAISGKIYYDSSIHDVSSRAKTDYVRIQSFIRFLEARGYKTADFYTPEELFDLYTRITGGFSHSFYDSNGFAIRLLPSQYVKEPETGIIKPRLVYIRSFERLY